MLTSIVNQDFNVLEFTLNEFPTLRSCIAQGNLQGIKACIADWAQRDIQWKTMPDEALNEFGLTLYDEAALTGDTDLFDYLLNELKLPFKESYAFSSLTNGVIYTRSTMILGLLPSLRALSEANQSLKY